MAGNVEAGGADARVHCKRHRYLDRYRAGPALSAGVRVDGLELSGNRLLAVLAGIRRVIAAAQRRRAR